jgi:hypothetical protein
MSMRPTHRFLPSFSVAILLASISMVGCKDADELGDASIEFELGNAKLCSEVNVSSIRVVLSRGEGEALENLYDETFPCTDTAVIVEDIEPQAYDLLVQGLFEDPDKGTIATFDNLGAEAVERKIEIFEGSLAQEMVLLTARPADLLVRWDFGFTNCMGAGIDRFRIRAFEVGGGNLLLEDEIDCEATSDVAGGYRPVPDLDRVLNGSLLGEVGVTALNASGTEIGEQTTFAFAPVGAGYPVKLTLNCDELLCTGTGTVD